LVRTVKNFVLGLETGWLFPRCCFRADRPGVQRGFRVGRWLAFAFGR
jgi:hypothetical protein